MRFLAELPEGAIPNSVIEVVGYLDTDGEQKYCLRIDGDVPYSTHLGLLRFAEHDLVEERNHG